MSAEYVGAPEIRALAADTGGGTLVLADGRAVGHRHPLRMVLRDSRFPVRRIPGVLVVEPSAREAFRAAVARTPDAQLAPDTLADRMAEAGEPVRDLALGDLVAEVPATPAEREDALARAAVVDEDAIRLRSAVKARDGFFTTFFVSTWSRYVARWCAGRGLTPNQVTVASLLVALAGAAGAATGSRIGYVAAALALYFSFVLDCTDGQLARYTVNYSRIGSWLDATFDRVKEYAVYAGLAAGAGRNGDDVWLLAVSAMALMTTRHIVDFAFNETRGGGDGDEEGAGAKLSGRLNDVGWTVWARRMIILPIGERWALIAVLTAVTTPRITFVVLLIGCAFAACYTSAGRILRSLPRRAPQEPAVRRVLFALADTGPLAAVLGKLRWPAGGIAYLVPLAAAVVALGVFADHPAAVLGAAAVYVVAAGAVVSRPLAGRLDWLVPPAFRAAEYSAVIALTARVAPDALPGAFGLVAVIAYHHYDTVYRLRGGHSAPPRALVWGIGGQEGRVLLIAALAAAGATPLRTGIAVFAVAAALAVLAESIAFWVRGATPDLDDPVPPAAARASGSDSGRPGVSPGTGSPTTSGAGTRASAG
ncbi:DUF5941 domain-containing protein [Uniformispora flossi]|uniref:DUF5941 domain-containing protein n=1 Tax=Uniformispora flossi TaxID=3390723 RepID=UPI003C2D46C7